MSRSPLAYPLNRTADTDVGGAADLQTDVMRFMAILALCLVAIFALVQSIPLTPVEPQRAEEVAATEPAGREPEPPPTTGITPEPERAVVLTRPQWVPGYPPADRKPAGVATASQVGPPPGPVAVEETPEPPPPTEPEPEGFTLRFASDAALTRSVAAHHVGLYALSSGRAKRMTVRESRISFWDASTPSSYHQMEAGTVPVAVIDALARTGSGTDGVSWGVTLPGKMKSQLDRLLQEHRGGSLIITAQGEIRREGS